MLAVSGPSGPSPPPARRSGSSGSSVLAVVALRVRPPSRARAARDPDRRAAADAARLRRRAPLLRRPAAGRRDRPPAAALRHRRGGRARARVAARARARRRAVADRARSRCRSARSSSFASLSVLWSSADAAGAEPARSTSSSPSPCSSPSSRARRSPPGCRARWGSPPSRSRRCSPSIGLVEEATHRLIFYTPVRPDRERVLELLPRHVALPRPEPVRPPRRARDRDRARRRSGTASSGSRSPSRDRRVPLRGPLLLLLAVEPRGALRRRRLHLGRRRATAPSASSRPATAVLVLAGGGAFVADKVAGASTQRVTSDRSRRIDLTAKVFAQHPLVGVGLGSQPRASQAVSKNGGPPTLFVSHTTPLTVAAELGVVGLALYAALLAGAAKALLRVFRIERGLRARARGRLRRALRALALLQRLLRGSRHVARARRRVELPRRARAGAGAASDGVSGAGIDRRAAFAVLGVARGARRGQRPHARLRPVAVPDARRSPARHARAARPRRATARGTSASSGRRRCSRACSSRRSRVAGWRRAHAGGRGSSSRPASP